MEKRDFDLIRSRFKEWSGGFPPSSHDQVQSFCSTVAPAQFDQQQVHDFLLDWMRDEEGGIITLPSGLTVPRKIIMDTIDVMVCQYANYGFTDWAIAVEDGYDNLKNGELDDVVVDKDEDLETIDLLIGPIAAKFKDELEHAYDVAYKSFKRQSDKHVDAMLKKWAGEKKK